LVRPDLRALGNYAVSALECEIFLEKLEQKRSKDAAKSGTAKRVSSRRVNGNERSGKMAELQQTASTDVDSPRQLRFSVESPALTNCVLKMP
jgi:hypothetical protein